MSIKKKLGLAAMNVALGIGLIGGGTLAYFSDVEATDNTFTSGIIDINLKGIDDREEVNLSMDNSKPSDWKVHQIRVYNEGSLEVKDVKLNVNYTVTDAKANNGNEDFADHITVHIMDPTTKHVYANWVPLSVIEDLIVAEELKPTSNKPYQSDNKKILRFDYKFNDNGENQNIFQGDSIDFELTFEASQKEGELR